MKGVTKIMNEILNKASNCEEEIFQQFYKPPYREQCPANCYRQAIHTHIDLWERWAYYVCPECGLQFRFGLAKKS